MTKQIDSQTEFLLSLTPVDFEARDNYLTCSNFPAILGRGYKKTKRSDTRKEYLEELLGIKKKPTPYSAMTDFGKKYEKTALKMFEKQTGIKTYPLGTIVHDQVHPNGYNFIAGTPDAITEDGYVVEVKCLYYDPVKGILRKTYYDEVPPYYKDQAMGYVWLLKLKGYYFVQYFHDHDIKKRKISVVKVEWTDDWKNENESKIISFWDELAKRRLADLEEKISFFVPKSEGWVQPADFASHQQRHRGPPLSDLQIKEILEEKE